MLLSCVRSDLLEIWQVPCLWQDAHWWAIPDPNTCWVTFQ